MSDSIKKWEEMNEQESTFSFSRSSTIATISLDDTLRKEAYTILANYKEAAILKAADILKRVSDSN